jgi:hypothetical protein
MVEGRVHSAQWEAARYLLRFFDNNHRNIVTTRHVACVLPGFGQVSSAEWGPRVLRRAMPVTRAGRVSHLGPLSSFCNVILLGNIEWTKHRASSAAVALADRDLC